MSKSSWSSKAVIVWAGLAPITCALTRTATTQVTTAQTAAEAPAVVHHQAIPTPHPPRPAPPVTAQDIAQAEKLLQQAEAFFLRGDYDNAEKRCTNALLEYPLLARGQLMLGKIFLLRGTAQANTALVQSARRRFDMAFTLDRHLTEAKHLRDLCDASNSE